MKRLLYIFIWSILLIAAGIHSVDAYGNEKDTHTMEKVTMYLQALESISSKTAAEGSQVRFKVVCDIYDNQNNLIIPYGSTANGIVSEVKKANFLGRRGLIQISINFLDTPGGTMKTDLSYTVKGGYHIPLLFLGLLVGKNVEIPENGIIAIQFNQESIHGL